MYIRIYYMFMFHSYRWCTVTSIFLMYKTIDIVIVNVCRILLCIFQTVGRPVSKLLFLLHCLTWLVDIIFPIYYEFITCLLYIYYKFIYIIYYIFII